MSSDPEHTERLEVERDYYRSLPAQQFRDLVEEQMPRIWLSDPLVVEYALQNAYWQSNHVIVSRLQDLAQEEIRKEWIDQGIWKDLWNKKEWNDYQISGGWLRKVDRLKGCEDETPRDSPEESKGRPDEKLKEGTDKYRAIIEGSSRPLAMFMYQLMKECKRLDRCCPSSPYESLNSAAYKNIKASWVKRRIWLKSWDPMPGMSWGHEKPLRDFIQETKPWLPQLCVEGRVQRWTEQLVGTQEAGTWERDTEARGLTWTTPSQRGGGDEKSTMSELLPAMKNLPRHPPTPGLFRRQKRHVSDVPQVEKPRAPSWGLVKVPYEVSKKSKRLDFKSFDFPWDMPLNITHYQDRRFKQAFVRRLRSDFDSVEEAEDFYEVEHLKATQGAVKPEQEYYIPKEDEDAISRRYKAYKKWKTDYTTQLSEYRAQFRKIDWADFEFPEDTKIGSEHWSDERFKAAIKRRIPGLTDYGYKFEQKRQKAQIHVPLNEAFRISVENEDELQKRWEAQKTRRREKGKRRS
ncbi:hypothetical protein SCUP515_04292 [Seiridium cupressi]